MLSKKFKALVSCVLAIVMVTAMMPITSFAAIIGNSGTADDPYEIETAEDLSWFAEQVNGGETAICGKLMNDIDLNPGYTFTFEPDTGLVKVTKAGEGIKGYFGTGFLGEYGGNETFDITASLHGCYYVSDDSSSVYLIAPSFPQWTPIGYYNSDTDKKQYTGTFDGNGKTVSGLFYNNPKKGYTGLFGYIGSGGTVKKVTVANSYICGKNYVGGICGDNIGGTIINCSSNATISGYMYVGGICGNLSGGTVTNCYNTGKITGRQNVGSVLGNNSGGTVTSCCYLAGTAKDQLSAPQFGIGCASAGSNTADISGSTAGYTAAEFADGSVTNALNSGTNPYVWYQKNGTPMPIPYKPANFNNGRYEIRTAEDLLWFAAQTNGANSTINGKLMNDINLNPGYTFTFEPDTGLVKMEKAGGITVYLGTGKKGESGGIDTFDTVASSKGCFYLSNTATVTTDEPTDLVKWTPISELNEFGYRGSFDGCGHLIKNLYINNPETDDQGLFGHPDRATIQNLGLIDCAIIGNKGVGGIVASASYANVLKCFVTGVVAGNENVGGIYGRCDSASPLNNISAATVSGTSNVGVIIGSMGNDTYLSDSIGLKDNSIPLFGSGTNNGGNVLEFDDLSTGEACWFMNGNSSAQPKWFQNIGEGGDEYPVLDSTHDVVYQTDDGYASCNEHIKSESGFCVRCGIFLSDSFEPNEAGTFEIDSANKLLWFSYYVEFINRAANAVLTADIDLSAICGDGIGSFRPIGTTSQGYYGKFNGNNHTISNLYINNNDNSSFYNALFGKIENSTEITDILIENADITCQSSAGILVGANFGIISRCSVSGSITATDDYISVGGVCAVNSFGTITDCYSKATVTVNGNNNNVGGVCGKSTSYNFSTPIIATATGCLSICSVTATGDGNKVGPVIGYDNNTTISEVANNYYLADSETDSLEGTTFKTETQLKSGEVAYTLNNGVTDGTQLWYQTCLVGYPEMSGQTVYSYEKCDATPGYTNNPELAGAVGLHDYIDGICTVCGDLTPAVLITADNRSDYGFSNSSHDDYYAIANYGNLMWFSDFAQTNQTAKFVLVNDITVDNRYEPVGAVVEYKGAFDGNNHTVTFAVTSTGSYESYGFFGTISEGGSICNINLAGSITSEDGWVYAGPLGGAVYATPITNATSTVNIENKNADGFTGGLVGYFGGREKSVMENCSVNANVAGANYVGGLVGVGWSGTRYYAIKNCLYIGSITSTDEAAVFGAVVGRSGTNTTNYYNKVVINNVYYCTTDTGIIAVGEWPSTTVQNAAQTDKLIRVDSDMLESGEVTYALNSGKSDGTQSWYQNIDNGKPIDLIPKFTGSTVYFVNGAYTNLFKPLNTITDETNKLIYTDVTHASDLTNIIAPNDGFTLEVAPSSVGTDYSYCGTGTSVAASFNGTVITTYTLIVYGDVNGDSNCDALDCMRAELVRSGNYTPSSYEQNYFDVNRNGVYDDADFQGIMDYAVGIR